MRDKMVICISEFDCFNRRLPLSYGTIYKVVNEGTKEYKIKNDFGDIGHYNKDNFEVLDDE